jgi:hypothetical protein
MRPSVTVYMRPCMFTQTSKDALIGPHVPRRNVMSKERSITEAVGQYLHFFYE